MKKGKNRLSFLCTWLLLPVFVSLAQCVYAVPYFKDEYGHTNWQYVANWSSGILIILLLFAVVRLYATRHALHRANGALQESNDRLEHRVLERTATLNQSNTLLQETNQLLESEVERHRQTSRQLSASQSYVESILESMPLMLVGIDAQGVVTQWNRGAETLTGLSAKSALSKVLWEVYPIIPVTREEVGKALETGESLQVSRSQRGQFHFDIIIYPLANMIETGVVLLIDDVTKQVQSMNQLIQKDKLSAMGELAASMAQDINLPLRGMINNLDQASVIVNQNSEESLADSANQLLKKTIQTAQQEGHRTLAITNNLVDFAGAHRQVARPQNVVQLLEHALSLALGIFSNTLGLKFSEITINRNYEENLPDVVCHASELQQVFLSLLRHCAYALAEKARHPLPEKELSDTQVDEAANSETPDSAQEWKPQISLTLLESYEVLWIKIQHNGLGLTPAEQQIIFEPFFNNTLKRSGQSETTNLEADRRQSFSHFIVTEHHNGQLAVTSDVTIGTTFHMELPLK